jgi:23S rRNA pseudouridine955/2504/2580 synthase
MKTFIVEKKYNQKKLSKYLLDNIPNFNINTFYKILRKKDIKINGIRITKDTVITEGDEITVYIPDAILKKENFEIIYEDDNILIINKGVNLEVTGANSLTSIIGEKYKDSNFNPMPCHRLDRNTTGIVLFAKNQISLDILLNKFKNHEIEKRYYAWIYGIPKKNHERLEAYLFKDQKKSIVYISNDFKKGYQKIVTSYTVLEKFSDNTCMIEVEIETGKTHQIRAHLAHIGYPIIGDGKYGNNAINKKYSAKYQNLESYFIKFKFKENNGILDYLNQKSFIIKNNLRPFNK